MKIQLTKTMLSIVQACSTDEFRPSLQGMLVEEENGKLRLVATDGHMLAMLDTTQEVVPKSYCVVAANGLEVIQAQFKGRNPKSVEIEIDGRTATMPNCGIQLTLGTEYFQYRNVLPKSNREINLTKAVGFNHELITRAMSIVRLAKPADAPVVKWEFFDEMSPLRLTAEVFDGNLTILVMPMRLERIEEVRRQKRNRKKKA